MSTLGNITPHITVVVLPTSSPLIKFAILPRKIPIGETQAIISNKKSELIFFCNEKIYVPITIPIKAP